MITHTSNAGREVSHPNETNDCTVVALAHAMSISYQEAHAICAANGRRTRSGMRNFEITKMLNNLSGKIEVVNITAIPSHRPERRYTLVQGNYNRFARRPRRVGTTVAQYLRTLPKVGRFYLTCTSHAFAYVDGKLLDNLHQSKMRALMTMCWEIKLPETKAALTQSDINEMWERVSKIRL